MNPPLQDIAHATINVGYQFLQAEQTLVIVASPEAKPLALALEAEALKHPPRQIIHVTEDIEQIISAAKNGDSAPSQSDEQQEALKCIASGALCIRIYAPRPDLLKGISPQRLVQMHDTLAGQSKKDPEALPDQRAPVIQIPYPTKSWVMQVFPDLKPDEAIDRLWQALSCSFMLNSDKLELDWSRRTQCMNVLMHFIRAQRICSLTLIGQKTNLHLSLDPLTRWLGGAIHATKGGSFHSIFPVGGLTASIAPGGATGLVHINRPLMLAGERVSGLDLQIQDGLITLLKAKEGGDILQAFFDHAPHTRQLAAISLPVPMHHLAPNDQVFCNPNMDRTTAYALTLTDPTVKGALSLDLFFDDPDMIIEGTDENGQTHRLDDLLRFPEVLEERCRDAEFNLPNQGIDANELYKRLQHGKELLAEGRIDEGLAVLDETIWRAKESYLRDALRQPTDDIFFWRIALYNTIKETIQAIVEAERNK